MKSSVTEHCDVVDAATRLPAATHTGNLRIGESILPCAVLEDGTRVLARTQFIQAIGRLGGVKGGRKYDQDLRRPAFLTAKNLQQFIPSELEELAAPVLFNPTARHPSIGYRAELLPLVCEVFMDAQDNGKLLPNQSHIALRCRLLYRGFARVGIVALIDEATGFQEDRAKNALETILRQWISDELARWAKTFPDDYYKNLFRLRNLTYNEFSSRRPKSIGRLTKEIVYERLPPGVLEALEGRNPKDEKGHRKHKHHQWLTPDVGQARLREHLAAIVALMKVSKNWDSFKRNLVRVMPKPNEVPQDELPGLEDELVDTAGG